MEPALIPTTISVKSVLLRASIPVGTAVIAWPSTPSDRDNWLEYNGAIHIQRSISELVRVVGSQVPDYRGRFLRSLQSRYSAGQTVATLKSHNHTQPTHTHSFSGQLIQHGQAARRPGASFSSAANLGVSGWAAGQSINQAEERVDPGFFLSGEYGRSSFRGYVTFRHDTGTTNGYGASGIRPREVILHIAASWGIT